MKTLFAGPVIITFLLVFFCLSCNKSKSGDDFGNWELYRGQIGVGPDQILLWPVNEVTVQVQLIPGTLQFTPTAPLDIKWRLVSGPSPITVDTSRGYSERITVFKLSGLQIGTYFFEVSCDAIDREFNKSTCRIIVDSLSNPPKDYIFYNQYWKIDSTGYSTQSGWGWLGGPSGMIINISNIYNFIPIDRPFKVFIKNASFTPKWEEVKTGSGFGYLFEYNRGQSEANYGKGKLTIITSLSNSSLNADIKLLY